ncbi:MAG: type I glyceraldehyde-3-phosphate dehydrogenase [Bdellovibrionales bacterium]
MSQLKIGINGLGRIGRLFFRYGFDSLNVVAVNGKSSEEMASHLLQYDSVHGVWDKKVQAQSRSLLVDKKSVAYFQKDHPSEIPWDDYDVDIVVDCTGRFKTQDDLKKHLSKKVKMVLVSAPAPQADFHLVYGVNQNLFQKDKHQIISNTSCTTNCLAPLIKVFQEKWGIEKGFMTTVHSYTNDQNLLDSSHRDLRRARTAALNMIPTTTGAGKALSLIFPELKGKIKGSSVRVPVANVSLVDLTLEIQKEATAKQINEHFKKAAQTDLKNILAVEEGALVSSDFIGRKESSILDALSTEVLEDRLVKVLSWYDNEAGFSQRMVDFIHFVNN